MRFMLPVPSRRWRFVSVEPAVDSSPAGGAAPTWFSIGTTRFGYIDGDFDSSEREYVRGYIGTLVASRVAGAVPEENQSLRRELTKKFTAHFHEVFEGIDRQV